MRLSIKKPRFSVPILFTAVFSGCVHYHYHQDAILPGCGEPGVVRYGETCEVPTLVEGGEVLVQSPTTGATREVIVEGPISSRVIVSNPRSTIERPLGGGGWHRRDPENIATTRVDGGIDDQTVPR